MNILILTTHLNVGGIPRYVISLAKNLARNANKVYLGSNGGEWQDKLNSNAGIEHIYLPINTKSILSPRIIKSFNILKSLVESRNIDIIHANTRVTQFLGFLLYKRFKVPYVSAFHGCYRPHFFRKIIKGQGVRSIAVSGFVKKYLREKFNIPESSIDVVHNGIDIEEFSRIDASKEKGKENLMSLKKSYPLIGMICRLTPEKNVDMLIRAMPAVLKKYPESKLVIAGRGRQEDYLLELSEQLGLKDSVIFLRNREPAEILNHLDIFISLTTGEPFGLSVLEAQANKVPVIADSSGAMPEIVEDNVTGLILSEKSEERILDKIGFLLEDGQRRKDIAEKAFQKLSNEFSLERMGESTYRVYEKTLAEIKPGSRSKKSLKRILVIMPNWIGDGLMASSILRVFKENIENLYLGVIAHQRTIDIYKNNPFVDLLVGFDGRAGLPERFRLVKKISAYKFDKAFIFKPSFTQSIICRLSGIRQVTGPASKKFNFITKKIKIPSGLHKMDNYLRLAEEGFMISERISEFYLTPQEQAGACKFFNGIPDNRPKVILHPKANWPPKMWPAEAYAELADRFIEANSASIIFTGSQEDRPLVSKIESLMRNSPYNLSGQTSLRELAGIIKKAGLFVSGDTGIMHMAASLNTPVLALFGPTSPSESRPRGKGIIKIIFKNEECEVPCYKQDCADNTCMKKISVNEAFDSVKQILTR